jgi:hypothetical protein
VSRKIRIRVEKQKIDKSGRYRFVKDRMETGYAPPPSWNYLMKRPLQRINDKHRKAAQLMVRGLSLVEISREVGYGPNYWSRLKNEAPVFQECLAFYRRQDEQMYAASVERMYCEVLRLDDLRDRRKRQ